MDIKHIIVTSAYMITLQNVLLAETFCKCLKKGNKINSILQEPCPKCHEREHV